MAHVSGREGPTDHPRPVERCVAHESLGIVPVEEAVAQYASEGKKGRGDCEHQGQSVASTPGGEATFGRCGGRRRTQVGRCLGPVEP